MRIVAGILLILTLTACDSDKNVVSSYDAHCTLAIGTSPLNNSSSVGVPIFLQTEGYILTACLQNDLPKPTATEKTR